MFSGLVTSDFYITLYKYMESECRDRDKNDAFGGPVAVVSFFVTLSQAPFGIV